MDKNGQIKGRIRAKTSILNTILQHSLSMCIPSFNILALKVPEKKTHSTYVYHI